MSCVYEFKFTLTPGETRPLLHRVTQASDWIRFILHPAVGLRIVDLKISDETIIAGKGGLPGELFSPTAVANSFYANAPLDCLLEVLIYFPMVSRSPGTPTEPREMYAGFELRPHAPKQDGSP